MAGKLIFITGGARSGKSSFAEKLATEKANEHKSSLYYIATSKGEDAEMMARIRRHQADREQSDIPWQTIEKPQNIEEAIAHFPGNSVVLLDCMTILLTNELFRNGFQIETFKQASFQTAVQEKLLHAIQAIQKQVPYLVVVSNEVLHQPFDETDDVTFIYQKMIGQMHQQIVRMSGASYLVEAGIPIQKK